MSSPSNRRCRLYLLTPPVVEDIDAFASLLERALDGGDVASLQIRLKDRDGTPARDEDIINLARRITPLAQARGVAVLINDRPDIAREVGADGAHIGQSDISYDDARRLLGDDAIVGVTCHNSRHLALEAGERGADYVAFGSFYPTETKTVSVRAEAELLEWWQQMIEIPCVAIGGVTVENAGALAEAGADFVAVSSGVWNHPEGPAEAVAAFNRVLDACAGVS